MRTFAAFVGSVMGSAAFQLSVALFPEQLQHYAFLVKWVWIGCGLCWFFWLFTHPWMKRHVWCRSSDFATVPDVAPPMYSGWTKPAYNVQCVGVMIDQSGAKICFQNVAIPGQEVGRFREAQLRISYSLERSGEEVALVFPARWIGHDKGQIEIGPKTQCAVLTYFTGKSWQTITFRDSPLASGWLDRIEYITLPSGRISIKATLFGENNFSLEPFMGVLTLGKDGDASFMKTSF